MIYFFFKKIFIKRILADIKEIFGVYGRVNFIEMNNGFGSSTAMNFEEFSEQLKNQ